MARNGVWELEKILLRYCAIGGSSKGVRSFVERDLLSFAKKNPQINVRTKIQGGHPTVYASYITGYNRDRSLKNMSPEEVRDVLQNLRDTLGRRVPKHNEISIGVVEQTHMSVQGVWRNTPDLGCAETRQFADIRQQRQKQYGVRRLVSEFGTEGALLFAQKLKDRRAVRHQAALDALPKVERVMPTE